MKNRETLIEQYDDAVFALLMDEYAEESGAELLSRFQEEMDAGLIPEIPEELDQRCVDVIDAEFRTRKRWAWLKDICRFVIRLVFALFFLIGLMARTALDIWHERKAARSHAASDAGHAEARDDEPPIFLTP